jgi:hypothetical protein
LLFIFASRKLARMKSLRQLLIAIAGFIGGTTLGGTLYSLPGREDKLQLEIKDDEAVIEALADENAVLKEEINLQLELIERLKAERKELRDKSAPEL